MKNGPRLVKITQYLHESDVCPDQGSDLNGDDIIDFSETQYFAGKVLVVFDGSLRSSSQGRDWFPRTDKFGNYYYSRAANMRLLLRELRQGESLNTNEMVKFSNRTIIIYGSEQDPLLPLGCVDII